MLVYIVNSTVVTILNSELAVKIQYNIFQHKIHIFFDNLLLTKFLESIYGRKVFNLHLFDCLFVCLTLPFLKIFGHKLPKTQNFPKTI